MANKIKVRPMGEKDLPELAKVYVRSYKIYVKLEKWDEKAAHKLLEHYLKRQPDLAFVAEHDNKIVGGFCSAIKPWWDGNHLVEGELLVDPDHQNKGIGKLLLKTVLEEAVKLYDVTVWEATTFKKMKFPLSWYKQLGFDEAKDYATISGDVRKALEKLRGTVSK